MDALDELNSHIEALCAIAERERGQALGDLIEEVQQGSWPQTMDRAEVARLALDYAQWTHTLEGYRTLLRRGSTPLVVEK